MELLTRSLLDELEGRWRSQRAPIASRLRPGLTEPEIDALTADLGLRLPDELRVWYGWHDGSEPGAYDQERYIGPGHIFLTLTESVAQTRYQRDVLADAGVLSPEEWWHLSWFAFTPHNGSLVCDCGVGPGEPTPIRSVWWGDQPDEHAKIRARSLGELVTWFLEAFDTGAWCHRPDSVGWDPNPELLRWDLRTSGLL